MKTYPGRYGRSLAAALLATFALCSATSIAADTDRKPNILLIVADDLGYGDLGFQGGEDIPTPSLDGLAANGVRLSNGYVTSTWCSPTRAGLMTGRYQQRFGEAGHEPEPDNGLSLQESTLADRLQSAGYVTGLVGKWHLGVEPQFHPQKRGFDEFFGFLHGGHNFLPDIPIIIFPDRTGEGEDLGATPEGRDRLDGRILRGTRPVKEKTYLTDAFGREAASFIKRHKRKPFFLYLSFNAVHTPMQATDDRLKKFASITDPVRRTYNAMTIAMDEAIGDVMKQLRKSKLERDTLIFFVSDNGGPTVHRYAYNASDNTPLRGFKGITLEAGIRVPFVVSWPGQLEAGSRYDEPAIALDIMPTALAAAGVAVDPKWQLDGTNLLPFLRGQRDDSPHEALYWRSFGQMAVRQGDWKLVSYAAKMDIGDKGEMIRGEPRGEVTPYRLYNLRRDVSEIKDLASREPKRVADMLALWKAWDAQMAPAPEAQRRGQSQVPE